MIKGGYLFLENILKNQSPGYGKFKITQLRII
jgi:hypothetical protein